MRIHPSALLEISVAYKMLDSRHTILSDDLII